MGEEMYTNGQIVCKTCNGLNESGGNFCMYCGASLEHSQTEVPTVTPVPVQEQAEYGNPYNSQVNMGYTGAQDTGPVQAWGEKSGLSVASFICGMVAMFCCFLSLPLSIASIILGIRAISKGQRTKGLAIAGIIVSILSVLFYALILVFYLVGARSYPDGIRTIEDGIRTIG